jgi:hypothetical protein
MKVSRYERHSRLPSIDVIFACQIIFDAAPHEIFPEVYQRVKGVIKLRAQELLEKLYRKKSSPNNDIKICMLKTILSKISIGQNNDT